MARTGRPPTPYPRRNGLFVRFSDVEYGALRRALEADYSVASRRPKLVDWLRDLAVGWASELLGVDVTRSALRHPKGGVPDWKRWRLSRYVRRAAQRRRRPRAH